MTTNLVQVSEFQNFSTVCQTKHMKNIKVVEEILHNTLCEFEKIVNSNDAVIIKEALARPIPSIIDQYIRQDIHPEKAALMFLLDLVEKTGLTFLLFEHMLGKIETYIQEELNNDMKFSINAYAADIENPLFIKTIASCKYASKIIIEITEKKTWSSESIKKLKFIQSEFGIELAMDDINPMVSADNYSMQNLEKFKNHKCYMNIGKIDGKYFQTLAANNDYISLYNRIKFDYIHYKIVDFIIEWIETEEQYIFAKRLEQEKEFKNIKFGYQGFLFKT